MTWKKAGLSSVTRTRVRVEAVAALRVVRCGAGERVLTSVLRDQSRGAVPLVLTFSTSLESAMPLPRNCAWLNRRGHELPVADPGAIKKSRTSGLFWGLLWNNITDRFSAGRH